MADLVVRHAPLRGIEVPEALVPDMIDEFPALFVAAAAADGPPSVPGAAELRVKESDRLASMANGLRALGVWVDDGPDGATIFPGPVGAARFARRPPYRDGVFDRRSALLG